MLNYELNIILFTSMTQLLQSVKRRSAEQTISITYIEDC